LQWCVFLPPQGQGRKELRAREYSPWDIQPYKQCKASTHINYIKELSKEYCIESTDYTVLYIRAYNTSLKCTSINIFVPQVFSLIAGL